MKRAGKGRIYIRALLATDAKAFLDTARQSRGLHRPWVTAPDTQAKFRAHLKRMAPPANYSFVVCRGDSHTIVGVINISNIVRGVFQSGYLAYYAFAGNERQGLMNEGLRAVVRHAFGSLRLHRLEANIQPGNTASVRLAAACGFSKEGYSPRYLKIRGRWQDHERWAILAS
jgi:ribosomal-protein-alanine N-acetyltransferase